MIESVGGVNWSKQRGRIEGKGEIENEDKATATVCTT